MSDPKNPPPEEKGPDQPSAANCLKILSSTSKRENIRTIRAILDELLLAQKERRFKLSDWISVILGIIALGAVAVSIFQYQLAEKSLQGTYLLQLDKDTKEIGNFVSAKTPNIDNIVSKGCEERRGDLTYSNIYAEATYELAEIVDFYEFYFTAYSKYDLITEETWLEVCTGSKPLWNRNCFYNKEWKNAVEQRRGLSKGLAMCQAKQG